MPMAARRIIIDLSHPAAMTPELRRAVLATIFAAGVIRHVEQRHLAAVPMPNKAVPPAPYQSREEIRSSVAVLSLFARFRSSRTVAFPLAESTALHHPWT